MNRSYGLHQQKEEIWNDLLPFILYNVDKIRSSRLNWFSLFFILSFRAFIGIRCLLFLAIKCYILRGLAFLFGFGLHFFSLLLKTKLMEERMIAFSLTQMIRCWSVQSKKVALESGFGVVSDCTMRLLLREEYLTTEPLNSH